MRDISAIVYTSNTGFTRRYAQMLSRLCAIPAYDLEGATLPAGGTRVVYLGWLAAGAVKGLAKAGRHWDIQAVCAVGLAPDNDPKELAQRNRVSCPLFCVQGGYAPEKLRGMNKLLMSLITGAIAKTQAKSAGTPEEAEQIARLRTGCDFVREENLAPLLAWLREDGK